MATIRDLAAVNVATDLLTYVNTRLVEYRKIKSDIADSASNAETHSKAAADSLASLVYAKEQVLAAIATINPKISTVAARDADIEVVAARDADLAILVERMETLQSVVDEIDAIIAAPALVAEAETARDKAQAWATAEVNTEVDSGLFSAKHHAAQSSQFADQSAASADLASDFADSASAFAVQASEFSTSAANAKAGADTAYAEMQTVLANVENYDNTLGLLSPIAKQIVAAADVVDVYVYDTTKDSDGGAWRDRCSHLSWFKEPLNTATRGSRREFPQKALIVARNTTLTIYDMDVPNCPMWRDMPRSSVINWAGSSSILSGCTAREGRVLVGLVSSGARIFDFAADRIRLLHPTTTLGGPVGGIATSQDPVNWGGVATSIVNSAVNSIAATVLPGTPKNPETGLPYLTIAVGTAYGVSVIHWDGRVCNSAFTNPYTHVNFDDEGRLFAVSQNRGYADVFFPNGYAANAFGADDLFRLGPATSFPGILNGTVQGAASRDVGTSNGLTRIFRDDAFPKVNAAVAYVTSKYTTGHMIGDTKLALSASAADLTTLVGSTPLNDDFSSYADTAAMLSAGWTAQSPALVTLSSGKMRVEVASSTSSAGYRVISGLTVGHRYSLKATFVAKGGGSLNPRLYVGTSLAIPNSSDLVVFQAPSSAAPNALATSFVATTTSVIVSINPNSVTNGAYVELDDIRIDRVAEDRSVAGNQPVIVGSVTREVVAAGADLAGYSGFSASNYLEVPYSSAFDVGTGDICVTTLFKADALGRTLVAFQDPEGTGNGFLVYMQGNGSLTWYKIVNGVNTMLTAAPVGQPNSMDGRWHSYVGFRKSGVVYQYVDGALVSSASDSTDLTNAGRVIRVGAGANGANPFGGKLALTRVSSTAPTPAQIREMARQELALCQPGAKCLLSGSDNVQGLSYDDTTDLLYVAKAAGGTDVFKGLERVGSITMASDPGLTSNDHRGVSAKDGVVSIRTPNEVYASAPAVPLRPKLIEGTCTRLYDRDEATTDAVTTDATPKVIAKFPLAKGERGVFTITVRASQYADGAAYASYVYRCHAYRPEEGNIALRGAVTETILGESNAAMAAAITANTTTQTLDVTATGLAATNLVWTVEMERA